jgi:hypothetical protein
MTWNLGCYSRRSPSPALMAILGVVASRATTETLDSAIGDNQALHGASRVAEVFGPVTFWHEACLSLAGYGLSGTDL